jgi:heat-inducible transcriptional repressor
MDKRQENILKAIVEAYIKTVKPVGSKVLCGKFHCSSATIRNEMAYLESIGLLEKNHVSSGRVPSEKGYKYYVEHLMEPEKLNGKEMLKLQAIFQNQKLVISDAINECMQIISDLTNYTSIILGKNSRDNLLQKVDIISLDKNHVVALVCTDKGIVENKKFSLPDDIDFKELNKACEIINKMLVGTPIDEVSERLELDVKPVIVAQMNQYEAIYNIFYNAFNDFVDNQQGTVRVTGRNKLFQQPEYDNVEEIKRIANKLDDENIIKSISRVDNSNDVQICIGSDNDLDSNVTIIKKNYNIDGEEGTIAIIGPKRMDYGKVVSMLNLIQQNIDERNK